MGLLSPPEGGDAVAWEEVFPGAAGSPAAHMSFRTLMAESLAGMLQRPGRSALTALGTVLGIASLVATIGVSQTSKAQISGQFNVLDATQITVTDTADGSLQAPVDDFPPDADPVVDRLNGVIAAGTWWAVTPGPKVGLTPDPPASSNLDIYAATPGAFEASETIAAEGRLLTPFEERHAQRVAVVGSAAAAQLRLPDLADQPALYLDGQPFTVVGIVGSSARLPQFALSIVVPATTAASLWGPPAPAAPAQMLVHSRLGAADVVGSEVARALSPTKPTLFSVTVPPNPTSLRAAVTGNLDALLAVLAGLLLAVGAVSITNTTLVAILERSGEIGLRRALGARPVHIAAQFLVETTLLGLLGGLVGSTFGMLATVVFAAAKSWTAVADPRVALAAVAGGAAVGLIAGLHPAIRAARMEPAEALRR